MKVVVVIVKNLYSASIVWIMAQLSSRQLEETIRVSPYHVAEHHPMRPESLQPHTEWSSQSGSELPSVEADVYV